MDILVIGAGVLGSLYAARLQEAGNKVTVLARGRRLQELRERGILLVDSATGRRSATPVRVAERLLPEDEYTLAIVLVRKNQLPALLPDLAANRCIPTILFMVNNAAGPQPV